MIRVNGQDRDIPAGPLLDILATEGFDRASRGIAVALNGAVVPKSAWDATTVAEGDSLEIVRVLQGG